MSIRYEVRYGLAGYDVRLRREKIRERRAFPEELRTEAARRRYAEGRASALIREGKPKKEAPAATFAAFSERWLRDYVQAEGLKPSTQDAYARNLRLHLVPLLGSLRLDAINDLAVQRVKLKLQEAELSEKTKTCVLSLLSEVLTQAVEWGEIGKAPKIKLPRFMQPEMGFYDFEEWASLVDGANRAGPMVRAAILLGGDAGLRRGEILALEKSDFGGGAVTVQRSEWAGQTGKPKGGKTRRVPLTARLAEAVKEVAGHLRGPRLLYRPDGGKVTITTLQSWLETACRRAGLPPSRNLHKLRHTFCSHLAMRGVPAKVIQELAGHADLKTTMRYMHLAGGSLEAGIAILEGTQRGLEVAQAAK